MDHVYNEKEADGILAHDSRNIAPSPENIRSDSMENQKAGNNQSKILKKYFDPQMVIFEEESFRGSNDITIDQGRLSK